MMSPSLAPRPQKVQRSPPADGSVGSDICSLEAVDCVFSASVSSIEVTKKGYEVRSRLFFFKARL